MTEFRESPEELLEEYLDGVLDPQRRRYVEKALMASPELRVELERVRRFQRLLESLAPVRTGDREAVEQFVEVMKRHQDQRRRVVWLAVAAVAAAVLLSLPLWTKGGPAPAGTDPAVEKVVRQWEAYGRRLGALAEERRAGRVPRMGLADIETPPASAQGLVFRAALEELGVAVDEARLDRVRDLVTDHFETTRTLGPGVAAEALRSESALRLYRTLRIEAGAAVADAWYDIYRPGLADLDTATRVPGGTLARVVLDRLDPEASRRYLAAYEESMHLLRRRYGTAKLAHVLERLAPDDERLHWRDASQDGIGRDAVLAIRAELYRAAAEAGADRLYLDIG